MVVGYMGYPAPKRAADDNRGVMQKSLFRQEAMDKTLSPDELDRLMRVTGPKGWLALIALLALVAAAVVWGVLGTIPVAVHADEGVLLGGDSRHRGVPNLGARNRRSGKDRGPHKEGRGRRTGTLRTGAPKPTWSACSADGWTRSWSRKACS